MSEQINTDYLQGSVILEISTTKLANGQTKASGHGCEFSAFEPAAAVLKVQEMLQEKLLRNQIEIGM